MGILAILLAFSSFFSTIVMIFFTTTEFVYIVGVGPSRWPAVEGTVVASKIYETENEGTYRHVWFDYMVDGEQFTSDQKFKPGLDEDLKYAAGNKVMVHYNPNCSR